MAAPIITLTDATNTTLPILNFGVVDAGNQTGGIQVRVWNNFAAATNIADAINPVITTKTYNGLDGGDSVANGNEIVTNQMIQVQCTSAGQTSYFAIGGANILSISDVPPQSGNTPPPPIISSGNFASCLMRAVVPASASSGNINFLIRVTYAYN